ncbi:ATP-binding cassette domain-containing protein [Candidatus Cyanaurora vandensis]|uniref:ABC transporter ATP-binding protein n=1 Tax=Candidatus Cyanaurora vandensis TaxID=2714958 RepID=UPI00257C0477|nr:ATP-binding cassette domain-containing protein [Candidatus Cyanaurora vandensis]
MTAIAIDHLQKNYGTKPAVVDLSLKVEPGQIYGLLGPNGAGKTTTMRCLATLERPDGGELWVAGISVRQYPREVRACLGYVAQEVAQDKVLTGRELLELHADLYHLSRAEGRLRIQRMLELLELNEYATDLIGSYSGGIKKRLDIACGLLHNPQVLLLDEPTVGLDINTRLKVWAFLKGLRSQGIAVLLTSHYLEEIDVLADRVAIIDQGRVLAEGTPDQLKTRVGGDRITVRLQEFTPLELATRGIALLQGVDFVREVVLNRTQGNALNLVVTSPEQALARLESYLKAQGLPVFSIGQSRPSLDDVFLITTGQSLQDAQMAQVEITAQTRKKK